VLVSEVVAASWYGGFWYVTTMLFVVYVLGL